MKNTKLTYTYADSDNHKTSTTIVLAGRLTGDEIAAILKSLDDGEYFIPSQVGLADLQSQLQAWDARAGDPFAEDGPDHVWHRIDGYEDFEETSEEPTVAMRAKELLMRFTHAAGRWEVEKTVAALRREYQMAAGAPRS